MTTFKGTSVNAEKGFKDRVVTPGTGASVDNLAQMVATSAVLNITSNAKFDTGIQLPPHASITGIQVFVVDAPSNAVNIQVGNEADPDAFLADIALGTTDNTIIFPNVLGGNTDGVATDLAGRGDDWLDVGAPVENGIDQPLPIWAKLSQNPTGGADIRVRVLYTRPIA